MSKGQKTFWHNTLVWMSVPIVLILGICAILEYRWAECLLIVACALTLVYLIIYGILELFARIYYKYRLLGQVETEQEMQIFLRWWPWLADGQIDVIAIDCKTEEEKAFLEKILPVKIPKILQIGA